MLKKLGLLAALSVGLTGTAQEAMDMTKCPVHEGGMSMEEAHASGMKNPHAANGLSGSSMQLDYLIYSHEGKQLALPRNGVEEPSVEYLRWQRKEIFKG